MNYQNLYSQPVHFVTCMTPGTYILKLVVGYFHYVFHQVEYRDMAHVPLPLYVLNDHQPQYQQQAVHSVVIHTGHSLKLFIRGNTSIQRKREVMKSILSCVIIYNEGWRDRQINRHTYRRVDGQTHRQTDRQTL